jgi:hypothetical protein
MLPWRTLKETCAAPHSPATTERVPRRAALLRLELILHIFGPHQRSLRLHIDQPHRTA